MNYFETIPDVLPQIFSTLPITISYLLRKVCKKFRNIVKPLRHGYRLLVLHCAKHGYLNIMKFFHSALNELSAASWVLEGIDDWAAIKQYTWLNRVKFAPSQPPYWCSVISSEAAHNGNVHLLMWMEKNYPIIPDKLTLAGALHAGQLDLASMINEKATCSMPQAARGEDNALICEGAIACGKIEALTWLEDNRAPIVNQLLCQLAVDYGRMVIIEYVFAKYNTLPHGFNRISTVIFLITVRGGNMNIFDWIMKYPISLNNRCLVCCATWAHIPATEYVIAHGYVWNSLVTVGAIKSGNIDYIQWAYNKGYIKLESHLYYTAPNLSVLKWLDSIHCPINTSISFIQANADLPMIKHMYKAGFKLSVKLFEHAVIHRRMDMVLWLHENNCSFENKYLDYTIKYGYDDLLWILIKLGYKPTSASIASATLYNRIDLIEKFIAMGINPDEQACTFAAASGSIESLRILLSHNCPYNLEQMLHAVEAYHNHDAAEWIMKNMIDEPEQGPTKKRARFE